MSESFRSRVSSLGATVARADLRSFPLGSPASRAAVRHMLETKQAMEPEGYLFRLGAICRPPSPDQTCHCPPTPAGTFALCTCFLGSKCCLGSECCCFSGREA